MRVAALLLVASVSSVATAAPYDDMFKAGNHWTYASEETVRFGDDGSQGGGHEKFEVECRVDNVRRIAGARVSTISCTPEKDGSFIAGVWVATSRGMWSMNTSDSAPATAKDVRRALAERMIVSARPRTKTCPEHYGDKYGMGTCRAVAKVDGRWCVDENTQEPNGAYGHTTCFANGTVYSYSSGSSSYSDGGSDSETTFVRIR